MTSPAAPAPRCSDAARLRADPPIGTAPMIRRWLLIEHPGPWPVEALDVRDLPAEVRDALSLAARDVVGRVMLIRRPGRAARTTTGRSWAVVTDAGSTWGTWHEPTDLRDAAETLRRPPRHLDPDPVLLVCAHGVHDTCCAVRGRPVAATLAEAFPGAVWECSHVGGDRFAPNVVVLPDGTYYGYLDPDEAPDVVRRHLGGQVSAAHLRGLTRCPPAAQAAIGAVHRRLGPYGPADVVVHDLRQPEPHRWEVVLGLPDGRRPYATVVASRRPAARLTCRAARETSALDYDVVELRL